MPPKKPVVKPDPETLRAASTLMAINRRTDQAHTVKHLLGAGGKGIRQMKTGGMVKETALHLLHKGEMVLPASVSQHIHKLIKKAKDIKNIVKQ